jgi:hypothetical protein
VVLHFALTYSGVPFYNTEPAPESHLTFLLLALTLSLNQAWCMGALFFLAGYFTPGSYDRKGPASFLQGRLVRLGIPLSCTSLCCTLPSSTGATRYPGLDRGTRSITSTMASCGSYRCCSSLMLAM